jgi:Zn-finger nucleic acid-binding protein
MEKVALAGAYPLVLDHCRRCGGVWFDAGEVTRLRSRAPKQLWDQVVMKPRASATPCHGCQTPLDRAAERCTACGRANRIDCPSCSRALDRHPRGGMELDRCGGCGGVWVDHDELASLWSAAAMMVASGPSPAGYSRDPSGNLALDWVPGDAVFELPRAIFEVAVNAPDLLGAAAELALDAAGAVFEAVLWILAGLLDGI